MARVRKLPRSAAALLVTFAVVLSAAFGISSVGARSDPRLPTITAKALLASTIAALRSPFSVSGNVRTSVDLGLPQIPGSLSSAAGGIGISNALGWINGTQRFRVWRSADGVRIQHLGDLQEQDLVVNRRTAWWWDSTTTTATKLRLGRLAETAGSGMSVPSDAPAAMQHVDPTALARRLIATASTCGEVSVSGTTRIAGHDAYLLSFAPSAPRSLVGSATVAVDAATRLPLDVQVVARAASDPSVDVGFTSVSFEAIAPSIFAFTPPTGATVRDRTRAAVDAMQHASHRRSGHTTPRTVVKGACFARSIAVRLTQPLPAQASAMLPYAGPLLSAITVRHGMRTWLLAGPVSVATLQQRAATLP